MPFKSMKQERKALLGVAAALALIVLGLASWSDAPDPYAKFDSGKASGLNSQVEDPPSVQPLEDEAEDEDEDSDDSGSGSSKKQPDEGLKTAPKTKAEAEPSNDSANDSSEPAADEGTKQEATPRAPVKKDRPRPIVREPAPTRSKPVERSPRPQPVPTVTSAGVRALKSGASSKSVVSALGQPLTNARMNEIFGPAPMGALLAQEPAGLPCSYYRLAPGEPAPLVRICFDASDRLASRDFVAPPS